MPQTWLKKAIGIFWVAVVPVLLTTWASTHLLVPWQPNELPVFLILTVVSFLHLANQVQYDPGRIKQVSFRNVPPEIKELIVETTNRGEYINIEILNCLDGPEKLSQNALSIKVTNERGIKLTPTQAREYVLKLEGERLIESPITMGKQPKEYQLTHKGKWVRLVISQVLPKTNFEFYWRNYVGLRNIPPQPQET
ncbi:MAG TPA: hypothetical protein VGR53_11540 [Nitrososphaerales archaeon]|nr:hypothetical protein [Nitrososphaerales archaeon]